MQTQCLLCQDERCIPQQTQKGQSLEVERPKNTYKKYTLKELSSDKTKKKKEIRVKITQKEKCFSFFSVLTVANSASDCEKLPS